MNFDPQPFLLGPSLLTWLLVVGVGALVALFVALVVSLMSSGARGPAYVAAHLKGGVREMTHLSLKRIGALATLTFKESLRRKALLVFVVFALLFMFAGWFLDAPRQVVSAKPYVVLVLKSIQWITALVALLLACWGLPEDIKARSLHTVVTKPVHRTEIVIGRMLGYSAIGALVVLVMGAIGYVWIQRSVPETARDQLIGRVPVYGHLVYRNRVGEITQKALNVGDIWEYRQFIDGASRARAIFTFDELDVEELRESGGIRLEYSFEVFRTTKGDIEKTVQAQFAIVNPVEDLLVRFPETPFHVTEFSESTEAATLTIPDTLTYYEQDATEPTTVSLWDDLIYQAEDDQYEGNTLRLELRLIDDGQYIGTARTDLFIRLPDRPFWLSYSKAILGILLTVVLIVIIGTTASCFVKGPVATILTLGLFLMGQASARSFMTDLLTQYTQSDKVLGGGPFESVYRLVTQLSVAATLPETPLTNFLQVLDRAVFEMMRLIIQVIPNMQPFDPSPYIANGFDVPWSASLLPSLAITIGFLIPCIVLGYYSLQLRELEAK